ncbi:hypothetical protein H5410_005918 [Solanum commersonii]|uniref:Malonyl-CoA decarboxylase n=1 Tax=Solanum commersonii TaxID=4109 RepID=A0A9J6A8T8_SOLCO|nr:hypothetical protein H5410_005918 [Solanum commersonii]
MAAAKSKSWKRQFDLYMYVTGAVMNKKGLAILMRTKMRPLSPTFASSKSKLNQMQTSQLEGDKVSSQDASLLPEREFSQVRESMHSAMSTNKTEIVDVALDEFSEGYFFLSPENRYKMLLSLAKEYDLNRTQVRELMKQHLDLQLPSDKAEDSGHEEEGSLSAFYRIERNLRQALKPMYEVLFERLNTHPGGLKFLSDIRADILCLLGDINIASLRALDSHLKEKLITWLSPANLELHNITWDDPASLLEKIVAYEAVHPISNLIDLKRRLGIGHRCFGYFHPAIPDHGFGSFLMRYSAYDLVFSHAGQSYQIQKCENGCPSSRNILDILSSDMVHQFLRFGMKEELLKSDRHTCLSMLIKHLVTFFLIEQIKPNVVFCSGEPLIFIEVALMKDVAATIQEVLWDNPPISEHEASCAIFYSISSTQPGLSGINLGKFLIKRVVDVVKKDMPNICVFATLSPIPGYRQWMLSKLASSEMTGSAFKEILLRPDEEKALMDASGGSDLGSSGIEVMWNVLTSKNHEWTNSPNLVSALRTPMMRLCASLDTEVDMLFNHVKVCSLEIMSYIELLYCCLLACNRFEPCAMRTKPLVFKWRSIEGRVCYPKFRRQRLVLRVGLKWISRS